MQATIDALKGVRDQVVPDYQLRLTQAIELLQNGILDGKGGDITLTFVDSINLMQLVKDMRSAVYMLEQNLSASIVTLEMTQIMNEPAKRGRPKKEEA